MLRRRADAGAKGMNPPVSRLRKDNGIGAEGLNVPVIYLHDNKPLTPG